MKSIFKGFGEIWGAMLAVFGATLRYLVRCCDFGWLVGLAVRAGCPRSVGMSKGGDPPLPPLGTPGEGFREGKEISPESFLERSLESLSRKR